jgi:hypothetical protein
METVINNKSWRDGLLGPYKKLFNMQLSSFLNVLYLTK